MRRLPADQTDLDADEPEAVLDAKQDHMATGAAVPPAGPAVAAAAGTAMH